MTKKYEIVLRYINDVSVEIPDAETFVFTREFRDILVIKVHSHIRT